MPTENLQDLKILAVDDERITLNRIEKALNKLGVQQVEALETTSEALMFIENHPAAVDIVFVDMFMPDKDGVDLIKGLKRIKFEGQIAIVSGGDDLVISGAEALARTNDIKVLGSLKKPVLVDDLKALLSKAISPTG